MPHWLTYILPEGHTVAGKPDLTGQMQAWFLLRIRPNTAIDLSTARDDEFSASKWVSPADAAGNIISFKQDTYVEALRFFAKHAMREVPGWASLRDASDRAG